MATLKDDLELVNDYTNGGRSQAKSQAEIFLAAIDGDKKRLETLLKKNDHLDLNLPCTYMTEGKYMVQFTEKQIIIELYPLTKTKPGVHVTPLTIANSFENEDIVPNLDKWTKAPTSDVT